MLSISGITCNAFSIATSRYSRQLLRQGDVGEELGLLATVLGQSIISFSSNASRSNTGCRIIDSDMGPLSFSFCYDPYPSVPINNPIHPYYIPILHAVNHFQAQVPPHNYDVSELRRFLPRYNDFFKICVIRMCTISKNSACIA